MEIREVTQYNESAPFTGYGIWIVFELKYRRAHLIHPIHLSELMLSEYELVRGSGSQLWPINQTNTVFNYERFRAAFKERVTNFIQWQRSIPIQTCAKVIAEMDGIGISEALSWIGSHTTAIAGKPIPLIFSKTNRTFTVAKNADLSKLRGRPLVIVETLKTAGPASIYQISHLVKGRLQTVSDINRVVTYFVNRLTAQGILEIVA